MALEDIKKFVDDTNSFLNDIPDKIIHDYIINDFELPTYFIWELNYDELKAIYKDVNSNILDVKDYIIEDDEAEKIIYDLIILRRLVENLIKTHHKDKGRFEKENDVFRKEVLDELTFFPFTLKKNYNKFSIIIKVYLLLIKEKRLNKEPNQRKAFISLFFKEKMVKEPILWNGFDSDLGGFLGALVGSKIIRFNPSDFTRFAFKNFKTLKIGGDISPIKPNTYRGYQDKEPFKNSKDEWTLLLKDKLDIQLR